MKIQLSPIGFVKNERKEIEDDDWGKVLSEIVLTDNIIAESLVGIGRIFAFRNHFLHGLE